MSDSSANAQIHLNRVSILSLTGVLLLAFAASLGMAFNIDAIALSFQVSNARAGSIASAEMVAIAAGTLYFARLSGRVDPGKVYGFGIIVIIVCNTLSILVPLPGWLTAVRIPAGVALGAVVATVMATAGRSHQPQQTFGVINAAVGLMGVGIAFILPRALSLETMVPASWQFSPVDGLYAVYVIAGLLALLFIRTTPRPAPYVARDGAVARVPGIGWIALCGLGLLFFGHGLLGIFLVRIGREAQLGPEAIGYVFMAAGIVGIAAPLLAGYLGARYPSLRLSAVILALMLVLAFLLARASEPATFIWTAPLFAALPTALMPIFLGATASVEPSGRLTGSHPAFVMIGAALAPLFGGALSDSQGFTANGYAAMGCMIIAAVLMLPVLLRADRRPLPVAG